MKLVVGLGNPGRTYQWTRHNLGFWIVERLARQHGIKLVKRGLRSVYGLGQVGKVAVVLAKPMTYMNLSGDAVSRLIRFFRVPPQDLIVLQDDLDLPWGRVRVRIRGRHGGHKGIRSITEAIGSDSFQRVKVGIGRPRGENTDPSDYVLEPLTEEERQEFQEAVVRGVQAVEVLLEEGPQQAMERFHKSE